MRKHLVVVTPTLGRSPYLDEAVASVTAVGREAPLRHILVCPAAERPALCERFPDATVVAESGGGGLYRAIEDGLRAAGEWDWFTYINDDDLLRPGLAKVIHCHESVNTDAIAFGLVDLIDETGRRIAPFPVCRNPRWFYPLWWMGLTPFTQQGTLVSRRIWERLGGFDREFRLNADFAFWARAIQEETPFRFYRVPVAAFRMREGQLSADLERVAEEKGRILRRYFQRRPSSGERMAAWLSFRLANFGAYAERIRRRGWRRSETLLGEEGGRKGAAMSKPRPVRLVVPLQSKRPTGMGVAAAGAEQFLRELQPGYCPPALNRWFQRLNDAPLPGVVKMIVRLVAVQAAPFFCRGPLVFASHHAPLWRTGRHAIVIHDLISLHHPGQHPNQTRFFRRLLPRVVASAERVITISETMRKELLQETRLGPERIRVIPSYSPRIDRYRPGPAPLGERLARREFLFVGANFLHKNLDTAVEALGLLRKAPEFAGARLVVVGCRREIWEARGAPFAELEAAGALEVREYVPEEELERLYRSASALVYIPSTEGMGLPPLEAMAAGCPVICSEIPVLHETCGEAAFYVEREASALALLLGRLLSGDLDREVGQKRESGFARARDFSAALLREQWKREILGQVGAQPC